MNFLFDHNIMKCDSLMSFYFQFAWFDPVTSHGYIQTKLNTIRESLPEDEKRRHSSSKAKSGPSAVNPVEIVVEPDLDLEEELQLVEPVPGKSSLPGVPKDMQDWVGIIKQNSV